MSDFDFVAAVRQQRLLSYTESAARQRVFLAYPQESFEHLQPQGEIALSELYRQEDERIDQFWTLAYSSMQSLSLTRESALAYIRDFESDLFEAAIEAMKERTKK